MSETGKGRTDHGAYVRKVQEDTQSFAQGLIGEVERLRVLVARLESEKQTFVAQARDVETILGELGIADRLDRVVEVWNKLDRLDEAQAEFEHAARLTANSRQRAALLARAAACESRR